MRENDKALCYLLSYGIPMLSILESKDRAEANRILKRLSSYKRIYSYLGKKDDFERIAGGVYAHLKTGRRPRDLPIDATERKLRERLAVLFTEVVEDLRSAGYGREADKIEEFVRRGEFKNAYLSLKDLRETEKRNMSMEQLLERIDNAMAKINTLARIGSNVDDILWKMAEFLGANRIAIPRKKMVLINDESGNAACMFSLYLRRMGVEHRFISTKNVGDFWITKRDAENAVSPILKSSNIGEMVTQYRGITIIEDLNFLVLNNSFSEVYQFLQYVKNKSKGQVIVTGNFKTLTEREVARLRGLFDATQTFNSMFNLCSWGIVGIRERKNSGTLLLSKELVEDFQGEVVMIADFGGDKYIHPQRIEFEIADIIQNHLKVGDVIIDSIDLMIDENGLENIYTWLKGIRDFALSTGNRVYITTNNLIVKEREYIRTLFDIDIFYLSRLDTSIMNAMAGKMKLIEKEIEREIQRECAYNMEIIRQKYSTYEKYLEDVKGDVEKVLGSEWDFNLDFLLKTTPLRRRIEELANIIEEKSNTFNEIFDSVAHDIKIAKEYVDVEDLKYCASDANETYIAGDIDRAIDKIRVCRSKANRVMKKVREEAARIYGELKCVDYILPAYFQSKLARFEGGIESIDDFTKLYVDVRKILLEKIDAEYSRLRKYSLVSGISLQKMDTVIHQLRFCEYRKERDAFMAEFEKSKEGVMDIMKSTVLKVIRFLEDSGYSVPIAPGQIKASHEFEEVFNMAERVYNHLSMFISKKIDDLKKRYPDYMEKHSREIERIIVDVSVNPVDAISRYTVFMGKLKREMGERNARMAEIRKQLGEYYKLFSKYNLPFIEWYPEKVEEGEVITRFLGELFGGLNPEIKVNLESVRVDDDMNCHISIIVENTGNYEAKNISLEIYGIVKSQEKIESLKDGTKLKMDVSGKVEDPDSNLNIDVFYEQVTGDMVNNTFVFEVNVKGYELRYATGVERCALCRGKIFKDAEMVVCTECGATYHRKCAERLKKCKMCGHVFVF